MNLLLVLATLGLGWAVTRLGPRPPPLRLGGGWRPGVTAAAIAALTGAAFTAVREEWAAALVLLLAAVGLALSARRRPVASPRTAGSARMTLRMSRREAAAILGVAESASAETVREAYKRLIRRAHPDQGGTTGLAAQLNAARDVLLSVSRER